VDCQDSGVLAPVSRSTERVSDSASPREVFSATGAQVAAHRTRDNKELHSPQEVLQRHRELIAQFGYQADRVAAQAREQSLHCA
jgi:hypothetical protein